MQVTLGGTPLAKGTYTLIGCKLTWAGVTWLQPWAPRKPRLPWLGQPSARSLHSPDPLPPPKVIHSLCIGTLSIMRASAWWGDL